VEIFRHLNVYNYGPRAQRVSYPIPGMLVRDLLPRILQFASQVWVLVRAQQNGHGFVRRAAAATDQTLISATLGWRSEKIVVRDTHFAEREQKPTPVISNSRILGMGSHTKMPDMGFEMRRLPNK